MALLSSTSAFRLAITLTSALYPATEWGRNGKLTTRAGLAFMVSLPLQTERAGTLRDATNVQIEAKKAQEDRKENLAAAIKVVQSNELTTAQASRRYDVPYTTLRDHVSGVSKKIGAGYPTMLTRAEEQELVVTC